MFGTVADVGCKENAPDAAPPLFYGGVRDAVCGDKQ